METAKASASLQKTEKEAELEEELVTELQADLREAKEKLAESEALRVRQVSRKCKQLY